MRLAKFAMGAEAQDWGLSQACLTWTGGPDDSLCAVMPRPCGRCWPLMQGLNINTGQLSSAWDSTICFGA